MSQLVEHMVISDVMKLEEDSVELTNYNQETIDLYERDKKNLARVDELRIYDQIIKHIADIIRNNFFNKDVLFICGFLSYLLFSENAYFYGNGREFEPNDDSTIWRKINELNYRLRNRDGGDSFLNHLNIVQEIEKLENMTMESEEIYSRLGATIITGRGCCRHLSNFFKDVLVELGYYTYTITNSIDSFKQHLIDRGDVCDYNHLCVLIDFRGTYLLFDPTCIDIATISSYKAFSTKGIRKYTLSPISLMRDNQINYSKMIYIYNVMSMQSQKVSSTVKEKYNKELSNGAKVAHEILPNLSDDLNHLHNLISEYMKYFSMRERIIQDYNYAKISNHILNKKSFT